MEGLFTYYYDTDLFFLHLVIQLQTIDFRSKI